VPPLPVCCAPGRCRKGFGVPAPYPPLSPGDEGAEFVRNLRSKLRDMGLEDLDLDAPRVVISQD
jgi:hypothetical protein